jgi:AraC-like DNA-binding protein
MPTEQHLQEMRILAVLRMQIIPAARMNGIERLVLARDKPSQLRLPDAISVTPAGRLGKRVASRGRKAYGHHISVAQWPDDGQEALRVSMLWQVTAGNMRLRLGTYHLHVPSGYAVVIPPGIPAPMGWPHDGPNEFCDVVIITPRDRQLQCRFRQHRGGGVQQIENISVLNTVLVDDLDRIVEELNEGGLHSAEIASQSLLVLWLTLERELTERRFVNVLPNSIAASSAISYNPISAAQQYMQTHLHQKITADKVSQTVRLSRTQFHTLFRQQTGQTFVEYLTQLRLEWACRLLRETGWSVYYISTFVGFAAPAYYHRLFQRKMGMTPKQYRQKNAGY